MDWLVSLFHFSVIPNFPKLRALAHEFAAQVDLVAHFPQSIPWPSVVLLKRQTFKRNALLDTA